LLLAFAEEFQAEDDPRYDPLISNPDEFFESAQRYERGIDLPADRVPMSHVLFFEGSHLVGAARIRWRVLPILLLDGGHIGYEVRRTARNRGIGREILRQSVELARSAGIAEIYLTTADSNVPSQRVIESQGGIFEAETISPRTGERMRRYVIPS
jgi:predicted acetyltransferase